MLISRTVYLGRDNVFRLRFSSVDAAGVSTSMNFSGIYSMLFELVGSGIEEAEYTTLTSGSVIDTSPGSGEVAFRLGSITDLCAGTFKMRLAYKTASGDTEPTQLAHEYGPDTVVVRVVSA